MLENEAHCSPVEDVLQMLLMAQQDNNCSSKKLRKNGENNQNQKGETHENKSNRNAQIYEQRSI